MEIPEFTVATIRFGGFAKTKDWFDNKKKLIKALGKEADKYDQNTLITANYHGPFVFFNRRNEVWLIEKQF